MDTESQDVVARARRINRAWITRGNLATNTERYLDHLASADPARLAEVSALAVAKAREASDQQCDPKLPFYAALFSRCTKPERNDYLKEHFFTRLLSTEIQLATEEGNSRSS